MRYTCGRKYTRYMYNDDPQVRTPTTARPLRGAGIPSRTLSRIALHAVHDDSQSRRVVRKSLCFGKRSFIEKWTTAPTMNEPQHARRPRRKGPLLTPSYLRARGSRAAWCGA